mgnify:CR=1 FL=1
MSRSKAMHPFVTIDAEEVEADIAAIYTAVTNKAEATGVDKLFCQLLASVVLYMNGNINYAANQNLASRASGSNLDELAEIYYESTRPAETYAGVTLEFAISEAQNSAILIPAGTRVNANGSKIYFATDEDVYVVAGDLTATVHATCMTVGTSGNGFDVGEITNCVDVFTYYGSVANTTKSDGGSDVLDDDEFYDLMVQSQDAYSVAGPEGAYRYFAMKSNSDIVDVVVNSPAASTVYIYCLMADGTRASAEVKNGVLEICDAKQVRPLTDLVYVGDPEYYDYTIDLTYYIQTGTGASTAAIQQAIADAADEYVAWQAAKLGRDINPSKLTQMLVSAGAKRVVITSPTFQSLRDGTWTLVTPPFADTIPQLGRCTGITLTNGGYEDE